MTPSPTRPRRQAGRGPVPASAGEPDPGPGLPVEAGEARYPPASRGTAGTPRSKASPDQPARGEPAGRVGPPVRDLEGRRIKVHAAEDLIVFKKVFDRPKDISDIKAMLLSQKGRLDTARLTSDAKELLTEASLRELEELISEFG
jgi:hypothetical protein